MKILIHRGQNQIGGSIIEVATSKVRIVLDVGAELDEEVPLPPDIEGLFAGNPAFDAVFLSHYHGDHLGLASKVLSDIPVYIGEKAFFVHKASYDYLGKEVFSYPRFMASGMPIHIGDLTVTPYLCDHSAYDSYMLMLESKGKRILYTGDFRSNGRKSFPALLRRLGKVDVLISEGTTLSRLEQKIPTEKDLEERAISLMKDADGPAFIFMASTNIDRLVTAYKAAHGAGRLFLQDVYTASIASVAGDSIPNPRTFRDVRVFQTDGSDKQHAILSQFSSAKIGRDSIAKQNFLMTVRPSMEKYLDRLNEQLDFSGGLLFYSMWNGYKEKENVTGFLEKMAEKGLDIVDLHTSGHADADTLRELISTVDPDFIIPVHTENSRQYEALATCKIVYDNVLEI